VPSLFVIRGNDQGVRFDLAPGTVKIGRDSSNDVQLHDTEVSRHHAELAWTGEGFTLHDHNSSNGTFVNGARVRELQLTSGDQVQVGGTLMLYTGPQDQEDDLSETVAISPPTQTPNRPHIVRSISQDEGNRFFQFSADVPQASWLARARDTLQVIYNTALAISHTLDIDQLLQRILELIFESVEADRGCVMLLNPQTKRLDPKVRHTRQEARADDRITISKTILDYVMERREGVLTSDAQQDARWDTAASIVQAGIHEAICVPMQGRYGVVGVIYIDTRTPAEQLILQGGATRFKEDHLKLLIAIAHQAALAVEDTRYYSAMVQAERLAAVGQTIATLSHHIKNILQGIRGGSYLIEMGLNEHDESIVSKGWKIVEKNQQKISALVMDMLTFSKEREPDLVPSNLNEVVADVVELSQSRADEREVALTWEPDPSVPVLVFDPEGLHRAILNIVTNAIDAACETDRPGRICVHTHYLAAEAKLRVVVEDNGPGIPSDQLETLFSPFVSTKKSRGTGLGLPVSQKIVQEHGGQILVESQPGEGCRFIVDLPAIRPDSGQQTIVVPERLKATRHPSVTDTSSQLDEPADGRTAPLKDAKPEDS
jgi:signal transduction histidine kinase